MQNVGRFLHLDHERRLAASDVVGRPDPRVNPIDDADLARAAGTNEPACAIRQISAVWRRYVDFPPMFGPVRMTSWLPVPSSATSLGTNAPAQRRSTTG